MNELIEQTTQLLMRGALAEEPVTSPAVSFVVVEGPDAGREIVVDDIAHRVVVVGHAPSCDVRLSDRTVSRRHASFELEPAGIRLRDAGSSNGTFVGKMRVGDVILSGDEIVRLGGTALRVVCHSGERVLSASPEAHYGKLVGASPAMRRLYPKLERMAQAEIPVLIEGEPGTGKELVAEVLHESGPRRNRPFLVFDRGSSSPQAVELTLFGREEGARIEPGLLEQAHGGTLFLDEVSDLEPPLQLKLLRALERRELRRVGARGPTRFDTRVMAASRANLERRVSDRTFREELLEFLSAARIGVPPLRQRRGDVSLLARFFWVRFGADLAALPPTFLQRLEEHTWPGNVRELRNAVARFLTDEGSDGSVDAIGEARSLPGGGADPDFLDRVVGEDLAFPFARQRVLSEFQRRYVRRALERCGGNVTQAAATSGVGRRYFHMLKLSQR